MLGGASDHSQSDEVGSRSKNRSAFLVHIPGRSGGLRHTFRHWGTTFEREDIEFGGALLSSLSILAWLSSIPLSLALILLHRRSRLTAYLCGALLIPLSIGGFIIAGLFQSEVAAILVAAFSLPAWVVLPAVNWRHSRTRSTVPA